VEHYWEITGQGGRSHRVLNGVQTVPPKFQDSKMAQGPFSLQFATAQGRPGGVIKWRKVQIKSL